MICVPREWQTRVRTEGCGQEVQSCFCSHFVLMWTCCLYIRTIRRESSWFLKSSSSPWLVSNLPSLLCFLFMRWEVYGAICGQILHVVWVDMKYWRSTMPIPFWEWRWSSWTWQLASSSSTATALELCISPSHSTPADFSRFPRN